MESLELKSWLVALDRSEMDQRLIDQVRYWSKILKPERITFVNIRREAEIWDEVDNTLFTKMIKKERELDKMWCEGLKSRLTDFDMETQVIVGHGPGLEKLMELCSDYDYDLVIGGRKQALPSGGHLTEDLAKRIPVSFMLIPETATMQCNKVLVPTDSSSYAATALQFAHQLRQQHEGVQLLASTVYHVPSGYHYMGLEYDDFATDIRNNAQTAIHKQLEELNILANQVVIRLREHRSNAEHLQNMAIDTQADLIVVGSKGMTESAYILMGSTAARMMRHMGRAPLLILKRKGETVDFFNALGKLLDPKA